MEKINETIKNITKLDLEIGKKAEQRLDSLTKPVGSLGKLEKIAKKIVMIQNKSKISLKNKKIIIVAGDHGIAEDGVSAYPQEVTQQMMLNFLNGGAAINVFARHIDAKITIVDAGIKGELSPNENLIINKIGQGTKNISKEAAMSYDDAKESIKLGIRLVEEDGKETNIIGIGEMGIANTTSSSAISFVLTGEKIENLTGKGTGIDDAKLQNKINKIKEAIAVNKPDKNDPIDVLAKLGGFEIGVLTGVILGAAANRIPVVIDGFITSASALIASRLAPLSKEYMFGSHISTEPGHRVVIEDIGLMPLFNLNMRLGEGSGSALAISIIDAAVKMYNEMATFKEAGVSEK